MKQKKMSKKATRQYAECAVCRRDVIPKYILEDLAHQIPECHACESKVHPVASQNRDAEVMFACPKCGFNWTLDMQMDVWAGIWIPRPGKTCKVPREKSSECST